MSTKIFLIAGEHSGDVLGGRLITALKKREPDLEFAGIGGPQMEDAGLNESLFPMDELCVMGIWEVAVHLPRLIRLIEGVVQEIENYDPDVVVTIDLPDFNFEVLKRLRKRGHRARLVHYVAPSVWAWRPGRAKKIAAFLDGLMCLFPFEPPYFTKVGLKAEFTGHPVIEDTPDIDDPAACRKTLGIPPDVPVVGLFFGSRPKELDTHSGTIVDAVNVLKEHYPNLNVVVPTVPNLEYEVKKAISNINCPAVVVSNTDEKWHAMATCDIAIAVSGTICLELAYAGLPHVSVYKMHPLSWVAVKLLVKTKYSNLANILLGEPAVPEILQGKFTTTNVAKAAFRLLKSDEERNAQKAKLAKVKELLSPGDKVLPSSKAAHFVLQFAKLPKRKSRPKPVVKKKPVPPKKAVAQNADGAETGYKPSGFEAQVSEFLRNLLKKK